MYILANTRMLHEQHTECNITFSVFLYHKLLTCTIVGGILFHETLSLLKKTNKKTSVEAKFT